MAKPAGADSEVVSVGRTGLGGGPELVVRRSTTLRDSNIVGWPSIEGALYSLAKRLDPGGDPGIGANLLPPEDEDEEDAVDGRFRPKKRDFFGASGLSSGWEDKREVEADAMAEVEVAGRRLRGKEGTGGID